MMVSRLTNLCSGVSGVRPATAEAYAALINANITPIVHEFGSLGCSGDLAPLAHVALALMGEGDVRDAVAERVDAAQDADRRGPRAGRTRREGGPRAHQRHRRHARTLLILAIDDGLRTDATDGPRGVALDPGSAGHRPSVFSAEIHALRPHPGQLASAQNLANLLADSPIVGSHSDDPEPGARRVLAALCAPGSRRGRDTFTYATHVADIELAAAIDNPSVLADGTLVSNGNFHGAPVGYALDFLAIVLADVASMS
jgi:histidine ammonia-lyase